MLEEQMLAFALLGAEWVLWLLVVLSIVVLAVSVERLIYSVLNRSPSAQPELLIKKNTISAYPHSSYDFWLILNIQIDLEGGQRLAVLGKKGQGRSSFVHMLVGSMKKIKGSVFLKGKVAYLPEKFVYSWASLRENIAFYNENVEDKQVRDIYTRLRLGEDLKYSEGLSLELSDEVALSKSQLQRIALARVFCSDANIYILDDPFSHLSPSSARIVETILREKQDSGVMIILSVRTL